jgi:hypothetical protein
MNSNYSDDFLLGVDAHLKGAVKITCLVSGDLPIDQDSTVSVQLIRDDDGNCAVFVVGEQSSDLLRSESFEWVSKRDTTNRLFALSDYIDSAGWAAIDRSKGAYWNPRELHAGTIIAVLEKGYREIGETFNPSDWSQRWFTKGKARKNKKA